MVCYNYMQKALYSCMNKALFIIDLCVINLWVQEYVQGSQHQRNRAEQLDQNVERWAGGIFERIANCIAYNTRFMRFRLLAQNFTFRIEAVNHLTCFVDTQVASFNVLLSI